MRNVCRLSRKHAMWPFWRKVISNYRLYIAFSVDISMTRCGGCVTVRHKGQLCDLRTVPIATHLLTCELFVFIPVTNVNEIEKPTRLSNEVNILCWQIVLVHLLSCWIKFAFIFIFARNDQSYFVSGKRRPCGNPCLQFHIFSWR